MNAWYLGPAEQHFLRQKLLLNQAKALMINLKMWMEKLVLYVIKMQSFCRTLMTPLMIPMLLL